MQRPIGLSSSKRALGAKNGPTYANNALQRATAHVRLPSQSLEWHLPLDANDRPQYGDSRISLSGYPSGIARALAPSTAPATVRHSRAHGGPSEQGDLGETRIGARLRRDSCLFEAFGSKPTRRLDLATTESVLRRFWPGRIGGRSIGFTRPQHQTR